MNVFFARVLRLNMVSYLEWAATPMDKLSVMVSCLELQSEVSS